MNHYRVLFWVVLFEPCSSRPSTKFLILAPVAQRISFTVITPITITESADDFVVGCDALPLIHVMALQYSSNLVLS